jgi:hypothetical protein
MVKVNFDKSQFTLYKISAKVAEVAFPGLRNGFCPSVFAALPDDKKGGS